MSTTAKAAAAAARALVDANEQAISAGDIDMQNNGKPFASGRFLQTTDNTVEVPFTLTYNGVTTAPYEISWYLSQPTFASDLASSFTSFMQYSSNVVGGVNVAVVVFPVTVEVPTAAPTQQPTSAPPPTPPLPYVNICGALGQRQNCSVYNYVVDTVAGTVPTSVFVPYGYNDDYYGVRNHPAGYTTFASHPGSTGAMII